jgi:sugar phosphate isomerase/epimerase
MRQSTASMQPTWTGWFDLERVIADSLIGTADEVRDRVASLDEELGLHSLLVKQLSPDDAKRRADLETFASLVRRAPAAP